MTITHSEGDLFVASLPFVDTWGWWSLRTVVTAAKHCHAQSTCLSKELGLMEVLSRCVPGFPALPLPYQGREPYRTRSLHPPGHPEKFVVRRTAIKEAHCIKLTHRLNASYRPTSSYSILWRMKLTLNPLTCRIWWTPNNSSRWQMGFNSAFKGLIWVIRKI